MIHYKKLLVLLCLLTSTGLVYAQQHSQQNAELMALLRQLEQMQCVVTQAASQPIDAHSRYHFDYQRLNADLQTIRTGINHYLSPQRAQPRDLSELSGDYQQETANRGK